MPLGFAKTGCCDTPLPRIVVAAQPGGSAPAKPLPYRSGQDLSVARLARRGLQGPPQHIDLLKTNKNISRLMLLNCLLVFLFSAVLPQLLKKSQ